MNEVSANMISRGERPLAVIPVNGTYLLGIYQGSLSKYDILIRYRQKEQDHWSRLRTPKHIHWAVDVLIKHYSEPTETDSLLDHLLSVWSITQPMTSEQARQELLNQRHLLEIVDAEAKHYPRLASKGEYSVKFLILIARLLMAQEKTNNPNAFMFKNLLEQLKKHRNIFEIVSTATYR